MAGPRVWMVTLMKKSCLAAALALLLLAGCAYGGQVTEETPALPDYEGGLLISELMAKNRATVPAPDGRFRDWVELENRTEEPIELEGFGLSDEAGEIKWRFPAGSIEPGGLMLLFLGGDGETEPALSLSQGESLYLFDGAGREIDSVLCQTDEKDLALARNPDGSFEPSVWPSPGYTNDRAGYEAFAAAHPAPGPLVIEEIVSAGAEGGLTYLDEACDWLELRNLSDGEVELSEFYLSDQGEDYMLWQLPQGRLAPGESLIIFCQEDEPSSREEPFNTGFSLSALRDCLYLSRGTELVDYVSVHDLSLGGSLGREEGRGGFFYYESPSPGEPNQGGMRAVSAMPQSLSPDGVFDGADRVLAELSAPGEIYYTTDGSLPNTDSPRYTGPIELSSTTIIRAAALEEGCLMSRTATFSYFIDEGHSLPVLSLVVDDRQGFDSMYSLGRKGLDIPANLALYDGETGFSRACDVSMKGWTSLSLPKKSMGVSFKGRYGGPLDCDVFGNGVAEYSSLSIRGGQDYTFSIFRNELFQELCLQMSDKALTQESKFCALYINGEYWGLYCLKEDFSRQYYASHAEVSPESVTMLRTPAAMNTDFFTDVVQYCWNNSLVPEENYQHISEQIDIDSFIDWFIIEGYSANTDLQGNVRLFRSTENGNKWAFALYDLDWAFHYSGSDYTVIMEEVGNAGNQLPPLAQRLAANPEFRDRLLRRFAELNATVLSNENVLAEIDRLQALIEDEVPRDRERWGLSTESWYVWVDRLRSFITDNDWDQHNIDQLCRLLHVSAQEREEYFGKAA